MDHRLLDGAPLIRRAPSVASVASVAFAVLGCFLAACSPTSPTPGAEERCTERCEARAPACAPKSCERGCRFVLDRLVEHEGATILACVARASGEACARDATWSRCAVAVGPYADGGPPPPHIPRWDEEKDDNEGDSP